MRRQTLMIGKHQYEVDYIEFSENSEYSTSKYVIFRKFELINDLPHDTDFYIMSKDTLDKWISGEREVVWPYIVSNGIPLQSSDPGYFITSLTKKNAISACYDIYSSDVSKKMNVKEDTFRVWHPQTMSTITSTIYVQTIINNIRFHILGDLMLPSTPTKVDKEWRDGHGIYTEYIDYKVPSLKHIFNSGYWYDNLSNNISDVTDPSKNIIYTKDKDIPTVQYYFHTAWATKPNTRLVKTVDDLELDLDYKDTKKNYYLFVELGVSIDNGQSIWWNHEGDESTEGYNSLLTEDILNAVNISLDGTGGLNKGRCEIDKTITNGNFFKVEVTIPENTLSTNDDSNDELLVNSMRTNKGSEEDPTDYNQWQYSKSTAKGYYGISTTDRKGSLTINVNNTVLEYIISTHQPDVETNEYLQPKQYKPTVVTKVLTNFEYNMLSEEAKEKCKLGENGQWIYEDIQVDSNTKIATPFGLVTYPYEIVENNNVFSKKYVDKYQDIKSWNYIFSMTPYTSIDDTTSLYVKDDDLPSGNVVFVDESKFKLKSRIGFVNGEISIINEWDYPMTLDFTTFQESYEYVNDVKFSEYENFVPKDEEDLEDDEESEGRLLCYFRCDVATSKDMKYVIWTKSYDGTTPDNFSIGLREIFSNWNEVPDTLCIRVQFIDKYIGQVFNSPVIVILKEKIKYMVNDIYASRSNMLVSKQEIDDRYDANWLYKKYNKDIEVNIDNFNFIDNIRCVVKNDNKDNTTALQRTTQKPSVLYKPIFYRVSELQTINITRGYTQNIGINLKSVMTKVNMFTLVIENEQFTEIARNDIYVIFKVDPSNLSNTTGKYHIISDDNDEYISSGTYNINE